MINQDSFYRIGCPATALSGTTAVKGTGVDRLAATSKQAESLELLCKVDATTGTPDSFTATFKLQHSATDVDGNYVDVDPTTMIAYAYLAGSGALTKVAFGTSTIANLVISTATTVGIIAVDARGLHRWVRAVVTPAFVNGSGPTVTADAILHFSRLGEAPNT